MAILVIVIAVEAPVLLKAYGISYGLWCLHRLFCGSFFYQFSRNTCNSFSFNASI